MTKRMDRGKTICRKAVSLGYNHFAITSFAISLISDESRTRIDRVETACAGAVSVELNRFASDTEGQGFRIHVYYDTHAWCAFADFRSGLYAIHEKRIMVHRCSLYRICLLGCFANRRRLEIS